MDTTFIKAKQILNIVKNTEDWFGYDYNINLYRGCSHGCIYCDTRSECYNIKNPNIVAVKKNCIEILRQEIESKRKKGIICTGSMSDPYNPLEKKYKLTQSFLKIAYQNGFGVAILTKSDLIRRDIELIKKISKRAPVIIGITITTIEDYISKIIEPNVSSSSERFNVLKELTNEGIFSGVISIPILPFISDYKENIYGLIELAKENGANFIYSSFGVTLRDRQRDYFYDCLDNHFPGMSQKYKQLYGNSYYAESPNANELYNLYKAKCDSLRIEHDMKKIIKAYQNPELQIEQPTLF